MSLKVRTIKFSDEDWQTMTRLAEATGLKSVSQLVQMSCQQMVESAGGQWVGGGSWGSPERFNIDSAEVALRGLPPMADDDTD